MPREVGLRRIYDPPDRQDGVRVLVDRLWPRGVARSTAELDEWIKDVAPSAGLRTWFGHDPDRFDEFRRRYRAELSASPARDALLRLRELARGQKITILTATRDLPHSHARVLADLLARPGATGARPGAAASRPASTATPALPEPVRRPPDQPGPP